MDELEELKKELQTLMGSVHHELDAGKESFDRGFARAEAQAKDSFEQLIAQINENTLAVTKRIEEEDRRFDERMDDIEARVSSKPRIVH